MNEGGRPTANIYVDGFNLYRQKVEHHPHTKWLDLENLARRMLPTHEINRIRYFTALVRPIFGADKQSPIRQQVYIEALLQNPKVTVHYGQFRVDKRRMPTYPLRIDEDGKPATVPVRKIEEKGTDVSLASYLLLDAFKDEADVYVLVSNDPDFAEPLRIVRTNCDPASVSLRRRNRFPPPWRRVGLCFISASAEEQWKILSCRTNLWLVNDSFEGHQHGTQLINNQGPLPGP